MLERLKGIRYIEILLIVFVMAAGVLLLGRMGTGNTDGKTSLEGRMESVLARVEGAGQVRVVLRCDEGDNVQGAVIVAGGAGDVRVRLALGQAAQALLGVDAAQIEVLPMEGGGQ